MSKSFRHSCKFLNWTCIQLPHLKVLHGSQVGKNDSQNHKHVPNLVTVSAKVEFTRVVSFRASKLLEVLPDCVNVKSEQIRESKQKVIMKTVGK